MSSQPAIQLDLIFPFDLNFGEHIKLNAKLLFAKGIDRCFSSGLLLAELVAGKSDDFEALFVVLFVKRLKWLVLTSKATLAGDVHDQDDFAFVLFQVHGLAIDVLHLNIEKGNSFFFGRFFFDWFFFGCFFL